MSRHELTPLDRQQGFAVVIGWDPPLATYFAIIRSKYDDVGDDDDPFLVWIGTAYGEIDDPKIVVDAVRLSTMIPVDILQLLRADRELDR